MERAPIRNRNVGFRKFPVGELRRNPANHRRHPDGQRAALDGIMQEVGYVGTLLGFLLPDGTCRLIDGHLRQDTLDDDYEVDVCIVDLTPDEVSKVLATHDGIGALAQIDHQALEALMQQAQVETPALQAMLADMAERSLDGPVDDSEYVESGGMPDLPSGDKSPFQQMTFTLHDDQAGVVREALTAAAKLGPFVDSPNENSNGNALARIAETFLGQC